MEGDQKAEAGARAAVTHLAWIPLGAGVGFGASFLLTDLIRPPADVYYVVYFSLVVGFLSYYAKRTRLDLRAWLSRRMEWGLALGAVAGAILVWGVIGRSGTPGGAGPALRWDVLWRGLVYGTVDGLLLIAFPWVVAWRGR